VDGGTCGGAGGPPIFGTPGIEVAPEGFADGSDGSGPIEGIWVGYTVAKVIAPVVAKIMAYIKTGNPYNCTFTRSIIAQNIYIIHILCVCSRTSDDRSFVGVKTSDKQIIVIYKNDINTNQYVLV
jgi:hypothetical protein